MTFYLPELSPDNLHFPDVNKALEEPDGLLAVGGDLTPERVIAAYRQGIFPWFSDDQPILWWSPSERATIAPSQCHISKSMRRLLNKKNFTVTINHAFSEVIEACAQPRQTQAETWITKSMQQAYIKLHQESHAHSVEVWFDNQLVGGLYGVCVGGLFCGESMFSLRNNASKIAFIALCEHFDKHNGQKIDCQMVTPHLQSLGVEGKPRQEFINELAILKKVQVDPACWPKQQIIKQNK
ncbi:MAG: leucyl/phenylalanyl-tRNA--protein transferase [Psychromonas sp.]